MVILHIISGGESGGSKKHLLSLVNEMKNREVKNIIACFIDGELYKEAKKMGMDIYLFTQTKRFDLSVVGKLKDICKKENVDIVNSHGGRANFICYFLKKSYKAKYITTIHSDYESDYKGNKYKTLIYTKINKLALKSFDYYVAVSEGFKNLLIKRGFNDKKIFTIYNGIDIEENLVKEDNDVIIKKHSLKKFNRYIAMVARLHPIKGHKDFLEALELISDSVKNTGVLLVGDGSYKDDILFKIKDYKIKDNIIFVGFKEPDDFYKISDFTVLTSYSESFPLVILESGLYSKTVIASDVGGIPEIIKPMKNGILIESGNIKDIAEKLKLLLNNPCLQKKLGDSLHNDVLTKFSIRALGYSYESIWKEILMEE